MRQQTRCKTDDIGQEFADRPPSVSQVLGSTDPVIAAEGSLRKSIFTDWKKMGLASEPNVGDNGVHASASPFEALCERLNWVGE